MYCTTMTAQIAPTLILGHRGSPREAMENTLRSLSLAVEHGADGVELDVQRSLDGVPVVIHDPTLDRTIGRRGIVADLAWSAIARRSRAMVPSLEQVCAWAAACGAWLNVEIKAAGVEREVIGVLRANGLIPRSVVSSFDPGVVERLCTLDSALLCFLLTDSWHDGKVAEIAALGAGGVCLHVDAATETVLEELRSHNLPVIVWTVNRPARVRDLLLARVAGIITDDPAMAVAQRRAIVA